MKRALICLLAVLALWGLSWSHGDNDNIDWYVNTHYTSPDQAYCRAYYMHIDSGTAWRSAADSSRIAVTVYTEWRFLGSENNGFQYIGRLWQIDTTYDLNDNDTITVTVQTTHNPSSEMKRLGAVLTVYDIHDFGAVNDTGSFFKWFPPDSASVQTQTCWVRSKIVYTAWQDTASATLDVNQHVSDVKFEEYIAPIHRY